MSLLELTLNTLTERFSNNKELPFQLENGTLINLSCEFKDGVTEKQIREFEGKTGWIIPEDYREFLLFSNGAYILSDETGSNGIHLLQLDEIEEYTEPQRFQSEYYIIGFTNEGHIIIDSEVCQKGKRKIKYLYWIESLSPEEEKIDLNSNFELWFDRFIVASGSEFWRFLLK